MGEEGGSKDVERELGHGRLLHSLGLNLTLQTPKIQNNLCSVLVQNGTTGDWLLCSVQVDRDHSLNYFYPQHFPMSLNLSSDKTLDCESTTSFSSWKVVHKLSLSENYWLCCTIVLNNHDFPALHNKFQDSLMLVNQKYSNYTSPQEKTTINFPGNGNNLELVNFFVELPLHDEW